MKRIPAKKFSKSITKIKPFFTWQTCLKCKSEFKRELGWKCNIPNFASYAAQPYYDNFTVCKSCCETKEEVLQFRESLIDQKPRIPPNRILGTRQ